MAANDDESFGSVDLELISLKSNNSTALDPFLGAFDEAEERHDPVFELSQVRARELEYSMIKGQQRAEAAVLGAGFLGGASAWAISAWVVVGLAAGVAAIVIAIVKTGDSPAVQYFLSSSLAWGSLTFFVRAFLLYRKMFHRAYWSFVYMMAIWGLSVFISCIIRIALCFDDSNMIQTLCGSSSSPSSIRCRNIPRSSSKFKTAQILFCTGYVIMASGSCFAMAISMHLAENNFQAASTSLILTVVHLGVCLPFCGAAFSVVGSAGDAVRMFCLSAGSFCVAAIFWRIRYTRTQAADKMVAKELAKYMIKWQEQEGKEMLGDLDSILGEAHKRYLYKNLVENPPTKILTSTSKTVLRDTSDEYGTTKPRQITADLVTLFAQANAINEHFQECVESWSKGIKDAIPKRVKVKKHARAIEKLYRSYSGDASRLVDLVRSTITFTSIKDLLQAVKRIHDDPKVAVLNYKNRLREDFKAEESAGYRNVALSLIVVDKYTVAACCNLHVCELQLGLVEFEKIKNEEGHRNYVAWRNLRAE